QRRAARRVVRREWLHDQQLRALELSVLLGRHQRADDSADLHYSTSQWSTMPTIPASTGGCTGWNGKLASLPRTKNTSSPTPAPTASTATSGRPAGCRSAVSGCTSSSLIPVRFSSFRVATTSPITRANCMDRIGELVSWRVGDCDSPIHQVANSRIALHVYGVDDADDRGVDRTVLHARRHAGGAAADDQHGLADAGVDRVDGDQVVAFGFAARVDRPRDEQLVADEPRI